MFKQNLALLNPDDEEEFSRGYKDLEFGTILTLDEREFLLKIIVRPSSPNLAVFEIAMIQSNKTSEMEQSKQTAWFLL